jgi:hypothetical protein
LGTGHGSCQWPWLVYFYCIFLGKDISPTPLGQVLELALEYIAVEDFFDFVFWFTLNHNVFWTWYGLTRKGVIADRLKEGDMCHGVVPILLGELLDLAKRPLSVAMATGISMVRLVALATSPSASLA